MNEHSWRRLRARLTPARGYGRCSHCRMPWGDGDREPHHLVYQHATQESMVQRALFFVCEWCWPRITPSLRLVYLQKLLWERWSGWPAPGTKPTAELFRIQRAVWPMLGLPDSSKEEADA